MSARNRNNKKTQNGTSKPATPVVALEDPAVEGRLIDVQVWKTISKGKIHGASVEIPDPAAEEAEKKAAEEPRKPWKSLKISRGQLGKLIGPRGSTIKKFEDLFSVQISQPPSEPGAVEAPITKIVVEGEDRTNVENSVSAIRQFLITGIAPWSEQELVTVTVDVPKRSVREIAGEQGRVKASIGKHTRTQIFLPFVNDNDSNGTATIKISGGKAEDVNKAKDIMEEIVLFHCHPVTHPESTYLQMDVPQKYHGRILGPRGAHAARLEHEFKVRIFMPTQQQPNLVVVGEDEELVARCLDTIEDVMDDTDKKDAARAELEAKKVAREEAKAAAAAAAAANAAATEEEEADNGSDEAN